MLRRVVSLVAGRHRAAWLGLVALVLYCLWIGWPYFESIVVRDAAVTTWLHVATAPIDGDLTELTVFPGNVVGTNGELGTITNRLADRTALERALGNLAGAEARAVQYRQAMGQRTELLNLHAAAFIQGLDLRATNQFAALRQIEQRLATEQRDANRFAELQKGGQVSASILEAAGARVAVLEGERIAMQDDLVRTRQRRHDAERHVYQLDDGSEADWASRLERLRAEQELLALTAEQATARAVAAAAQESYDRQHTTTLKILAGALVWSKVANPGLTVVRGQPILTWIDPTVLLLDVPVSDVEASLLKIGAPAHVVLEGERMVRQGVIVLIRGSAATLGSQDLAALAKGRRRGFGQALVRVDVEDRDRERCPVGLAAYVDFPQVNIFRILARRLRL